MNKISEDAWKNISKRIKHLSQTAEYLVRKEFQTLEYLAETYHYSDYDPQKGKDVIRELDFHAFKLLKYHATEENETFYHLVFLGDVKFHVGYKELIILGLKDSKSIPRKEAGHITLNEVRLEAALKILYPTGIFHPMYAHYEIIHEFNKIAPICRHILFFDSEGKECKKNPDNKQFRKWCEQVVNAFYNQKKLTHDDLEKEQFIEIPLLVFGNNIQFVVCHPEEAGCTEPKQSDALLYLFQSSTGSSTTQTYLTPILITSLQNIPRVIPQIEELGRQHIQKHIEQKYCSA